MLVSYFYQGEPGESLECPNAFSLPSSVGADITFGHFLSHFPPLHSDRDAKLHYRFRAKDGKHGYIWLDVVSHGTKLPLVDNSIVAKILRMDALASTKRYSRLRFKDKINLGLTGTGAHTQQKSQHKPYRDNDLQQQQQQRNEFSSYSDTTANSGHSDSKSNVSVNVDSSNDKADVDLFDFAPTSSTNNADQGKESSSRNEFDFSAQDGPENINHVHVAPPKVEVPKPQPLSRAQLAANREYQVQVNVKKALEEKLERDEINKKEDNETEAARLKYDKSLTEWAFDSSKKKRNVRTLISTMQKVLWEDNKWKECGLGDVIDAKQVKLKYRRAMLVVHPDRLAAENAEIRFIAKRIFEAINEGYTEFLKTESV